MLFEFGAAALAGAIGKLFYDVNKSTEIDERAARKYAQAFEKEEDAKLLVQSKAEYADKRLINVVNKKRSIIQFTVPKFVEVYNNIQKIDIDINDTANKMIVKNCTDNLEVIKSMTVVAKKDFTDSELIFGCFIFGLGGMIVKDSERNLSAANNQMKAANVTYSQAESIAAMYDAITQRADRISDLLVKMNILFLRSIEQTKKTIEKNGFDIKKYNKSDKGILMTCVNTACAVTDIINIPVVDMDGKLSESAVDMIKTGEEYIKKINSVIENE